MISAYDYNFQTNYGTVNGVPVKNLITAGRRRSPRDLFHCYAHYMGVQFVETGQPGMTVAVGDLRVHDSRRSTVTGARSGMASGDAANGRRS